MNKFLVYTSNLPFMPKNMEEVINFAKDNCKFRIAQVELNNVLANVKVGDNIITKKGNSIYIIKTIAESLENLNEETQEYLEQLSREYGMKNVGITSVDTVIKFETWCKSAKSVVKNKTKTMNSINGISERIKKMFMPVEATDVRITTDGNICVATTQGYVSIDKDNHLTSYPKECTIDLPVYIISKPKDQLAVGDVIALENSYIKVIEISGNKITAIGYTGAEKTVHTVKDFLFNQTMVRVVVSLAGNIGGQINPMLLFALSNKKDKNSLLPLLMMNQNGSTLGINPMMLMLANEDNDISMKDILLLSTINGNNAFGEIFKQSTKPEKFPVEKFPVENSTAEVNEAPIENN